MAGDRAAAEPVSSGRTTTRSRAGDLPPASIDGAAFRWTMGLHRLDTASWLVHDARRGPELAEKASLLERAPDDVLVALDETTAPSEELLALVVAACSEAGVLTAGELERARAASRHPIEVASRLVQEDLCLLEHRDGAWRLVAACVCFPSRWSLREKLGASLEEIHLPVPGFGDALLAPTVTFFDRLDVARPVWRANWTLLDTPALHLPSAASRRTKGVPSGDLGRALWFRVERQTLRRLVRSGAIVFTIRTTVRPLEAALADAPGAAASLRATLATVPAPVAAYKCWTDLLAPLDAWLAERGRPGRGATVDGEAS